MMFGVSKVFMRFFMFASVLMQKMMSFCRVAVFHNLPYTAMHLVPPLLLAFLTSSLSNGLHLVLFSCL